NDGLAMPREMHVVPSRLKKVPAPRSAGGLSITQRPTDAGIPPTIAHPMQRVGGEEEEVMPEKDGIEGAQEDAREGKSPSAQAGEFVHEEMEHIREGKHGARSTKQAIAIGLSKARRAGVKLPPPGAGSSRQTRRKAAHDTERGRRHAKARVSRKRSRAT